MEVSAKSLAKYTMAAMIVAARAAAWSAILLKTSFFGIRFSP